MTLPVVHSLITATSQQSLGTGTVAVRTAANYLTHPEAFPTRHDTDCILIMSCRPPANSTYLTIGQDLFSINEYVTSQYNYSLHRRLNSTNGTLYEVGTGLSVADFVPAAFMVYTDLATLQGLWEPADYGSGVEYADGDLFPAPSSGLQIGLWLNGTQGCVAICEGTMDDQIALLIFYLERSRASKIFLRLGYEFDNPSFGYGDDPELYVLAFRKIVAECRARLSDDARGRVLFVWHSWAAPTATGHFRDFYPGDDFVDWIGVSIFQQVLPWSPYWGGEVSDVGNVLDFAKERGKPSMIAESSPFGGIELKQTSRDAQHFMANNDYDHDDWGRWFGKVLDIIDKYDVDMWCYINCDWESQPMWHKVGFGESRLSTNPHVMSQWHEQIIHSGMANRKFLAAGILENCGVKDAIPNVNPSDVEAGATGVFGLHRFYSFILVPFLVASGAFFIPYFILGGFFSRHGKSSRRERRPLLSSIDKSTQV